MATSFTGKSFTDNEIHVELPNSIQVFDVQNYSPWPKGEPGADWAWDESDGHFVCEVKDPESQHGLEDRDGIERIVDQLRQGTYTWSLVKQYEGTVRNHPPSSKGADCFIALVCIDGQLNPDWGFAAAALEAAMTSSGHSIPTFIVNIRLWNQYLVPRIARRIR